jgi:hypothetical protein
MALCFSAIPIACHRAVIVLVRIDEIAIMCSLSSAKRETAILFEFAIADFIDVGFAINGEEALRRFGGRVHGGGSKSSDCQCDSAVRAASARNCEILRSWRVISIADMLPAPRINDVLHRVTFATVEDRVRATNAFIIPLEKAAQTVLEQAEILSAGWEA